MALGNRRNRKRFFSDRSDYGLINDNFKTEASRSLASEDFASDPASIGVLKPALYRMDLIDEDIDEIRRHITNDRTQTDNNFTDANQTKLNNIETGADVTDATNVKSALDGMSLTDIGTPASSDRVLIQDASNSNSIKYASFDEFGGSGGGLTETPLATIGGRWQWASTDGGERVHTGNATYGPLTVDHSEEPVAIRGNTNLLTYSRLHSVNSTTALVYAYYASNMGIWCPNNGKKVKAKFSFRIQGAPASSTWGISLWDCDDASSGTTNGSYSTVTLRAKSSDVTVTTASTTYWTTTITTTNTINDKWLLPMIENRTGRLSTSVYIYGQIALTLVD
jgi:hypothetical protein